MNMHKSIIKYLPKAMLLRKLIHKNITVQHNNQQKQVYW